MPDGRRVRIFGVPQTFGLPQTKQGTQEAERREIHRVLTSGVAKVVPPEAKKEVPKVSEFVTTFLDVSRVDNKPSSVESKESMLKTHIVPFFGEMRLDEISYSTIQDFKMSRVAMGRNKKTVNNYLTCLRRMLVIARKRGLIAVVPEVEWLKAPKPEFDFLTFEEADRLLVATEEDWRPMVLLALRTGMRQGELLAIRWQDVDLVAGRLMVRQNVVRGHIGTPKSGKPREIPLGDDVIASLKSYRLLRGELVFCKMDGRMFRKNEVKHPLWRACRKAGLRHVSWHVLRHTFASHLAMRGASMRVIQELLGHSTIQMTMRYAHLAPEVARDAVRMLDNISRGSGVAAAIGSGAK